MWISYSDSEVNTFHPICERALNRALKLLGKHTQYQVLHHQLTGTLEMDFAIQNIQTKKYLCVIEVKRTPADVHSTRYQFQAMSYVQMNADESEQPFYILTNLEYAFSFRYDPVRPKAFQQMLKPGLSLIGHFDTDGPEDFEEKLADYFKEQIEKYCTNSYEYLVTLESFALRMEAVRNDPRKWKSYLAVLLYEYIRGAFTYLGRKELHDVRIFGNDVAKICKEASKVNFKDIFCYMEDKFEKSVSLENELLADIFKFGSQNVNGDTLAGILHQIVSEGHEHDGEVPTDLELARLVTQLSKHSSGELGENELLCDPAAGSGNLISAAIPVFRLRLTQIVANDVNPKLLELLSLRLGMSSARTVSVLNSPAIYNCDITDLDKSFFENVKVVVLNPPFVAGINCVERKQDFYKKIKELRQRDADTFVGLMPLEAVFLELLTLLVKPGTTIACVFPKTHLLARGIEARAIRRLILDYLGLEVIFTYPGDEIFDDVMKGTCILVGKVMRKADTVKIISSYEKIPDIDIQRFSEALCMDMEDGLVSFMPGMTARMTPVSELLAELEDGWRMLNNEMIESMEFVEKVFRDNTGFKMLSEYHFPMKRGSAGNSGGSDILFTDSRADFYDKVKDSGVKLCIGMRNARLAQFDIGSGDSAFLDISINEQGLVEKMIDIYNSLPVRNGRQQRKVKGKEEWMKILRKESNNGFAGNSVLIPRGIRTSGRVYLSRTPVFVSTNFVVCTLPSEIKAILLSTWMATIFYQLICEVSSKDQEGMRKMEVMDIGYTLVPDLDMISEETRELLSEEADKIVFLNLNRPEIRNVDRIWAAELFGEAAAETLDCAQRLLDYQVNRRNPKPL